MGKTKGIYYLTAAFLAATISLTLLKTRNYNYNLSALVSVWQGFADLNPGYVEPGTVLFKDSGYDGQFFYLNAKYLFSEKSTPPKVDSFYFRFHRIGFSVFTGLASALFGFENYALVSLILVSGFILVSFLLLSRVIREQKDLFVYLLNPFVLNSTLLLVADSVFVALLGIGFYFLHKSSVFTLDSDKQVLNDKYYYLSLVFMFLAVFTRETGVMFAGTVFLYLLYAEKYRYAVYMTLPVVLFGVFVLYLRIMPLEFKGINPMGFTDNVDWPFLGLIKSLDFSLANPKSFVVLFVFGYFLVLLANLANIRNPETFIMFLPLLGIVVIAAIGQKAYWESYDNITRMFAPAVMWVIFLKNKIPGYRDFGLMNYTIFFMLLTVARLIQQKPLPWVLL